MPNILIADDSKFQVQLLSVFLQEKGCVVSVAYDALLAWMTAIKVCPDAIILDISMPAGSGLDVLQKLKRSTKTQHIPVLIVSGDDKSNSVESIKQIGGSGFFPKPIDPDALFEKLCELGVCPRPANPPASATTPETSEPGPPKPAGINLFNKTSA